MRLRLHVTKTVTLEDILADPDATSWLKNAASTAVERDPVDAVYDAEWLAAWLRARLDEIQTGGVR